MGLVLEEVGGAGLRGSGWGWSKRRWMRWSRVGGEAGLEEPVTDL